jgi:hypothetical protein
MDHYREIKNSLTWHNEGKFEVVLVNGVIKKLNFCEPGKGPEDQGKALTSTNYKFLKSVHSCLGDLFAFIEEENKRLGYRYAREEEAESIEQNENSHLSYPPLQAETKLRPLINYSHHQDNASSGELMRDIG